MECDPQCELPPLPPKLRPKPQKRDIGRDKHYRDEASFQADKDAWDAERAERRVLMEEREQEMMRLRQQRRTPRQKPSGAQNRKTAGTGMSTAEANSSDRERKRVLYNKKAHEARNRCPWVVGQRVRISCGKHAGHCAGAVMKMHQDRVCTQTICLDGSNATVKVAAADIVPWPQIGQQINWMQGMIGEVATVQQFIRGYEVESGAEGGSESTTWRAAYKLSRVLYALPEHLKIEDGQMLQKGATVRLLPPHADAEVDWSGSSFVVKAICGCSSCKGCVELEHTFGCGGMITSAR